jgi:hypothetical protein
MQEVSGSIPLGSTKIFAASQIKRPEGGLIASGEESMHAGDTLR